MESDYSIAKTTAPSAPAAVDDSPAGLVARWTTLIREYEAFEELLRAHHKQPRWTGLQSYLSILRVEAGQTDRLVERAARGEGDSNKWRGEYRLMATTLAAKEGMWRLTKTCRGVLALDRRFSMPRVRVRAQAQAQARAHGRAAEVAEECLQMDRKSRAAAVGAKGTRDDSIFVNAVVDNGREWLRVLTTTSAQVMIELADNGWEWGEEGEGDEKEEGEAKDELEDIAEMSLVQTAMALMRAAQTHRCKGAYPRICIVLTRVDEAGGDGVGCADKETQRQAAEIAHYLGKARRGLAAYAARLPPDIDGKHIGVAIHTARAPRTLAQPPDDGSLEATLRRMLPDLSDRLTATVNIDTSILVGLASDITHGAVAIQPWFPQQRHDEIRKEAVHPGQVLKTLMGEALRGRRLVCTQEAATAFRSMIRHMAQPSEKQRAQCLLGDARDDGGDNGRPLDRMALVQRFRALSQYPEFIPDDLMLPIEEQGTAWGLEQIERVSRRGRPSSTSSTSTRIVTSSPSSSPPCPGLSLPAVACRVAQGIASTANHNPTLAVFFYGWALGHTTITTNLEARNRIARLLEQHRTSSHEQGPLVWVSRTARSLNGTNPADGRRDSKR
ncbi:hypothetical protein SCUCBS95973_005961 [Sporothrix curviconia]|uniref:DUF1308 domain-containing protein n=1 Tax=Sporothrix curviconia TaxID=1260050 RepID=A0ABP0C1G7_9PEZI